MAKQRWKRTLSLILSAAMIWGMSGMPAFAEEPASPAPVPEVESEVPLVTDPQPETKTCTCTAPCAEGSVNTGCPVCSAEGADLSACKGESPDACTCTVPCTEDSTNAECPVCSKDWNACAPKTEVPPENEETKALIEKLPGLEEYHQWQPTLEPPPEDEGYQAAYDAAVAAHRKEVEEQVKAAREAYDLMTEEQKAAFDPALTAKLTTWETKLSQPVTDMEGRLSGLPSVEEFQNWKPTLTIPETDPSYQAAYDEAVAAHRKEVEDQVNAVREAYGALSEAERAVLDPALVEKLTTLEGILTPVMAAYAENGRTYNIGKGDVNLKSEGGKVTITGTSDSKWYEYKAQHHITVEGGTWTITLQDCKIKTPGSSNSAFDIKNGAHVTLVLAGNNEMYGGGGGSHPAIWVESGSTLTIAGDGSLLAQAKGGSGAAGIGAGDRQDFGDIIINDGTVTALGSGGGAGIGGGYKISGSVSGNVTINGGWVKAYGGHVGSFSAGAGIGAGENTSYGGTITINGGVVYAQGGGNNAASIGGGGHIGGKVSHGTFSTGTNGDAVIIAPDGIGDKSGHARWQAIFCGHGGAESASLNGNGSVSLDNNTFQVLGEVTPGYSLNVGSNVVLNINANDNYQPAKLIMDSHNLTNNGTVNVGNGNENDDSVLELHNHRACGGNGKLFVSNNGKLRVDLTEDMITLEPNSFVYSGQACKPEVTVKLDQWGYAKTYVRPTDYTVRYTGNTSVGAATAEVTPVSGGLLLGGMVEKQFKITAGEYQVTVAETWSVHKGCDDLLSHLPTHKTNPANITGKLEWFSDTDRIIPLTDIYVQDKPAGKQVDVYWEFTPNDSTNYPTETGTTTLEIKGFKVHKASIWNDKDITGQAIQKAYGADPFNVNAKIDIGSNGAPVAPKSQVTWTSSNSDVATVAPINGGLNDHATVTIEGVGTTIITATIAKYVEYGKNGQPDIANSYSEVQATFTLKVTEKEIYVDTVIATNRPYNGKKDVDVTATLKQDDIVNSDVVTVTATGRVDDPNVGDDKTVHVTYTLGGQDAKNYVLKNAPETKVNITKAGWDGNNITVTGGKYTLTVQNHRKQTYNVSLQNINPEISDATGNKLSLGNVTYEKGSVSIKEEGYFAEGDLKIVESSTLQVPVNYVNSTVEGTVATVSITVKSQNFTDYTGTLTVVSTNDGMNKITATAGEGGTISPSGDIYVVTGDKQEFKVQANEGYEIQSVKVDRVEQIQTRATDMSTFSYIFDQVKENHTIKATFKKLPTPPTPGPDEPGNGGSGRPGSSSGGSSTYDPQAKDPDRVQVSLEARKLLDGKTPGKQEFTFTLTDEKGKVVRTAENKGGKIVFDSLALLPGTYRYTMEEVNGSGGSAFGYDDTVYEAEIFVYTSGGKYTAMVSYYQDGKELDELPTFRNTTAPAAPGTDKENPITGGGPAFPAALTAMVSLGAIAFLWRKRS